MLRKLKEKIMSTMSFGQKIISGLFWGQLGMSGRALICFVVSILAARFLGAHQYGIYVAAASLIVLLIRFTEMGINAIYNRYIPQYQVEGLHGQCSYLVRRVFLARMLLLAIASFVLNNQADRLVALVGAPELKHYIPLVTIWFLVRATMDCFLFVIWAQIKMKFYSAVELGVSIGQLVGILVLRVYGISVASLIVLMILVGVVQLIFFGIRAAPVFLAHPKKVMMRPIVRFGMIIWLSTVLLYFVNKSIDIFMILHYLGDSSLAAYYDVAHMLVYTGGLGLLAAVNTLALPILSEAHSLEGMEGMRRSWVFLVKISVFVAVPPLFFTAQHGDSIIQALYGGEYLPSVPLLIIFAALVIVSLFLASGVIAAVFVTLDREKTVLTMQGFNGLLNVALNMLLIPRMGVWGAVIATGGSRVITALVFLVIALRSMKASLPIRFFGRLGGCLLVGGVATMWLENPGVVELFAVAGGFWLLVTVLFLKIYRFSDQEKETMRSIKPSFYSFLCRMTLIR